MSPTPSADTIVALSSGSPPAAIAVVRLSGPSAGQGARALAGALPAPRHATLRHLTDPRDGALLDQALLLWFPGPASATGEDLAELHLHGGRAVVDAVLGALTAMPGVRLAEPGEFTRRAFDHGRIDLAEAEGLADLLAAETEGQRRAAIASAGGAVGRAVAGWQATLLTLSARVEALLDFADEEDVAVDAAAIAAIAADQRALHADLVAFLDRPTIEQLGEGVSVVIAGPPNAGKSTLLNTLAARDVAIVAPLAGTTRDAIEVTLALGGLPFRFVDTAGLREEGSDAIEAIGMARARDWVARADVLLWLGPRADAPPHPERLVIAAKSDLGGDAGDADLALSAHSGAGIADLCARLASLARTLLPVEGALLFNRRQRAVLVEVADRLGERESDPLLVAENLRAARTALDRITGRAGTEAMLDSLFGRFCIGK